MTRKLVIGLLVLTAMCASAGCGGPDGYTLTPEGKLLATRDVFNATVNALAAVIEADAKGIDEGSPTPPVFTVDETRTIVHTCKFGRKLVDKYDAAVQLGQPTAALIHQFNLILRELMAYKIAAERAVE